MPGKFYRFKLTKGPYAGFDCRIIGQKEENLALIVKVRGNETLLVPLDWVKKKGNSHGNRPRKIPRKLRG
jgi:hypothetical protein